MNVPGQFLSPFDTGIWLSWLFLRKSTKHVPICPFNCTYAKMTLSIIFHYVCRCCLDRHWSAYRPRSESAVPVNYCFAVCFWTQPVSCCKQTTTIVGEELSFNGWLNFLWESRIHEWARLIWLNWLLAIGLARRIDFQPIPETMPWNFQWKVHFSTNRNASSKMNMNAPSNHNQMVRVASQQRNQTRLQTRLFDHACTTSYVDGQVPSRYLYHRDRSVWIVIVRGLLSNNMRYDFPWPS